MEIILNNLSYIKDNMVVLDNINYTFKKNKITSIINYEDNATNLFDLICALDKPSSGFLKIGNYIINNTSKIKNYKKLRFEVGYVFKNYNNFFIKNTVYDEISFGMKQFGYKLKNIESHIDEALKLVGLPLEYKNFLTEKLSSGEKVKVELASVLALNPKIILIDNIIDYLDVKSRNNLIKTLRTLKNKYNKTIIISTTNIEFINKVSDNVVILNNKIIKEGTRKDVFKDILLLEKNNIDKPKIIEFIKSAEKKKIRLEITNDIKDLLKDVYRNV